MAGIAGLDGAPLEAALEKAFAMAPVVTWVERLRTVDAGAHGLSRVEDMMADPWVKAHGLSLVQDLEGVGSMMMPGVAARLSRTPMRVGRPVRPVGSDAPAILERIGLRDKLDDLMHDGAISLALIDPTSGELAGKR